MKKITKMVVGLLIVIGLTSGAQAGTPWISDAELTHTVEIDGRIIGYCTTDQVDRGLSGYYRLAVHNAKYYTRSISHGPVDITHMDTAIKLYNADGSYMDEAMYQNWENDQVLIETMKIRKECSEERSFYELYDNWIKCDDY